MCSHRDELRPFSFYNIKCVAACAALAGKKGRKRDGHYISNLQTKWDAVETIHGCLQTLRKKAILIQVFQYMDQSLQPFTVTMDDKWLCLHFNPDRSGYNHVNSLGHLIYSSLKCVEGDIIYIGLAQSLEWCLHQYYYIKITFVWRLTLMWWCVSNYSERPKRKHMLNYGCCQ